MIRVETMVIKLNVRAAIGSVMVVIIGFKNINPRTNKTALIRNEMNPPCT